MSRRDVIIGSIAATIAAGVPGVAIAEGAKAGLGAPLPPSSLADNASLRRYMAASVLLPGGRILVTGGYDRKWTDSNPPRPLSSSLILDPNTGDSYSVAPMRTPRARHAAVVMSDGRVLVIGGFGRAALSSVEIYDPRTDRWQSAQPLLQPRYDHSAVSDGNTVIVLGGSAQSMLGASEVLRIDSLSTIIPA